MFLLTDMTNKDDFEIKLADNDELEQYLKNRICETCFHEFKGVDQITIGELLDTPCGAELIIEEIDDEINFERILT